MWDGAREPQRSYLGDAERFAGLFDWSLGIPSPGEVCQEILNYLDLLGQRPAQEEDTALHRVRQFHASLSTAVEEHLPVEQWGCLAGVNWALSDLVHLLSAGTALTAHEVVLARSLLGLEIDLATTARKRSMMT